MANIEEKVETLLASKITALGYDLYDVEYAKEGKDYFLRIYIDKTDGIDLDDCEKVSNEINSMLDEADYIKEQYFLEVSSAGIERVLRKDKHFEANLDKLVEIKLFTQIDKKKQYEGILKEYSKDMVKIETDGEAIEIPRTNIAQVKTVYNWDD